MYPNDAITFVTEISGVTTDIFTDPGDYTVLAVAMQQANNSSATQVKCGNDLVAKNYATNFSNVTMNYQCDDDILQISKTGNDNSTVIVTYVPYLTGSYSTTTQFGYNPTENIASSSDVKIYGAISAGELLITTLLIMALLLKLFELMARGLSGLEIKRRFLRYNGGDVPVDNE